jgi:hypothetical protein
VSVGVATKFWASPANRPDFPRGGDHMPAKKKPAKKKR